MIELMVAMAIMMIVSGIVMAALGQLRNSQKTIANRTAMHSGIRGATQLLQQEIGQAGLVRLPTTPTLSATANPPTPPLYCDGANSATNATWHNVSSVSGMFKHMVLTTLDGDNAETVKLNEVDPSTTPPRIEACFTKTHNSGTKLEPRGAFATGVVPDTGIVDGSGPFVLKMYGDINGDGNMVYVEYTCDPDVTHNLYRNVMPIGATTKPPLDEAQILLSNVVPNTIANPGGDPSCFHYERETVVVGSTPFTFVLNVAVTLTVETEQVDPVTKLKQYETKALLNVSPRNVVNAWSYAGMGYTHRIQSTPLSVTSLLPPLS